MKNLNPKIYRQRFIVEGFYAVEIDETFVRGFLEGLGKALGMTPAGGPYVSSPGPDCTLSVFAPWAESGATFHVWDDYTFFALDIFACKPFDPKAAAKYITEELKCDEYAYCEVEYED